MAHASTYKITFGGFVLVLQGDLMESEVEFGRSPQPPTPSAPIRADFAVYRQGRGLSHTLSWTIRREFATIAQARVWQWQRAAALPKGAHTLTVEDSGITGTLAAAHITQQSVVHIRHSPGVVLESVSILGGQWSTTGSLVEPSWPGMPAAPELIPVSGARAWLTLESGGYLLLNWNSRRMRLANN